MTNYEDKFFEPNPEKRESSSLRDIVQVGFRHKTALLICFGTLFAATLLYCFALTPKYESETKILVQKERLNPMVSTQQTVNMPMVSEEVTEEELNSEVEIILSDDLLRTVIQKVGITNMKTPGVPDPLSLVVGLFVHDTPEQRLDKAVKKLEKELDVEPVKKSDIITITYAKHDQNLPPAILRALDDAYIEKHLQVHRPTGQFQFFSDKAEEYGTKLAAAEDKLLKFSEANGAVKPELARDLALTKLSEFNGTLHETRAAIAETQDRINTLEKEQAAVPARITTLSRRLDNEQLMMQLKNTLLTLELKRNELLTKFQEDYRPVQEVEQEIAKTKAAIAVEDSAPLRDDTTDNEQTHLWIETELAKAKADLKGLQARATAIEQNIREYQASTHDLENKEITSEDLEREIKATEQNYLLYVDKREGARINDALDRTHILNVAIAEPPTAPHLPKIPSALLALIGTFIAAVVSAGLAFALEFMDSSFRTPREIEAFLNLPVLAAVPRSEDIPGIDNKNDKEKGDRAWWKKNSHRPYADVGASNTPS